MIVSYRKWIARTRFIVLFMTLTFVLYHIMILLTGWIQPTPKYKTPTGKAERVFQHHPVLTEPDTGTMSDRLRLFYWYGE